MKTKAAFVAGAGIGYLFGTRAGRQQFEKIKGWASDAWADPRVQTRVNDLESQATRFAKEQGSALMDKAVDAVKSAVPGTAKHGEHVSDDAATDWVTEHDSAAGRFGVNGGSSTGTSGPYSER